MRVLIYAPRRYGNPAFPMTDHQVREGRAAHYRREAERVRQAADAATNPDVRAILSMIAAQYERLSRIAVYP